MKSSSLFPGIAAPWAQFPRSANASRFDVNWFHFLQCRCVVNVEFCGQLRTFVAALLLAAMTARQAFDLVETRRYPFRHKILRHVYSARRSLFRQVDPFHPVQFNGRFHTDVIVSLYLVVFNGWNCFACVQDECQWYKNKEHVTNDWRTETSARH